MRKKNLIVITVNSLEKHPADSKRTLLKCIQVSRNLIALHVIFAVKRKLNQFPTMTSIGIPTDNI